MTIPCPFVFWGQDSKTLFLKVGLKDVQGQPDVSISPDLISFKAFGVGARGESAYQFVIKPFASVVPEKSILKVKGSYVTLELPKSEETSKENAWPRLVKDPQKYAWIKPDFDRMEISDDEEDSQKLQSENEYMKNLMADIKKTEAEAIQEVKTNYLFLYNLLQFCGYAFMVIKILRGLTFEEGYAGYPDVGMALTICQLISFAEVLHPMLGLVRTGVLTALIQTLGRNFVLFVLVWSETALHKELYTTYLILFWSLAEIFRYPFYMLASKNLQLSVTTWLRYSMWIPLYPLGTFCEWLIVWNSIDLFTKSSKYSLALPNMLNMSFYFPYFLCCYLLILPLGLSQLMLYMASQRRKKIPGTAKLKKN